MDDSLSRLASGPAEGVSLAVLTTRTALVLDLQDRLAAHGLLEPPADGVLAPASTWALVAFCRAAGLALEGALSCAIAAALLRPEPVLPLRPGVDLAGRVVAAMAWRGDWICRHPDARTIAYVEGMAPDGTGQPRRPDAFDDTRLLIRIAPGGVPALLGAWEATTAPGRPAVEGPETAAGAPCLTRGQHKAWSLGRTGLGTPIEQDALVQVAPLRVTRDANRDFSRAGDAMETGLYVLDQHGGMDAPRSAVGGIGAGCLVGRSMAGHAAFLAALREEPRWRVNTGYLFQTSVLGFEEL